MDSCIGKVLTPEQLDECVIESLSKMAEDWLDEKKRKTLSQVSEERIIGDKVK